VCNLLGEDVRCGRLPDDRALLGQVVRRVCWLNAMDYFGLRPGRTAEGFLT
jgi:glucuronate isomerase